MHASRSEHAVPPIEIDTLVPCAPDAAFDYFTRDIGRWWPLARYSCSQEHAASVQFDDGKLVETDRDGKRYEWGEVLAWERGRRLALTWHPGTPPEDALIVTVTFDAAGDGTRVKLVHSGWERLGAKAADARASYAGGWPTVLGRLYKDYCEGAK